jgi:hypothetical protein
MMGGMWMSAHGVGWVPHFLRAFYVVVTVGSSLFTGIPCGCCSGFLTFYRVFRVVIAVGSSLFVRVVQPIQAPVLTIHHPFGLECFFEAMNDTSTQPPPRLRQPNDRFFNRISLVRSNRTVLAAILCVSTTSIQSVGDFNHQLTRSRY